MAHHEETPAAAHDAHEAAAHMTETVAHEGHAEEHSAGMPQLDPAVFAPQIIWVLIVFAVFYVVMARVALPRIGRVIEDRSNRIADDLDSAERLKREADDAMAAYETALADARANAVAIAAETRDRLAAETQSERDKLEAELNEKLVASEKAIAATKADALTHVRSIAGDLSGSIVEKLLGDKADDAAVNGAIDTALSSRS